MVAFSLNGIGTNLSLATAFTPPGTPTLSDSLDTNGVTQTYTGSVTVGSVTGIVGAAITGGTFVCNTFAITTQSMSGFAYSGLTIVVPVGGLTINAENPDSPGTFAYPAISGCTISNWTYPSGGDAGNDLYTGNSVANLVIATSDLGQFFTQGNDFTNRVTKDNGEFFISTASTDPGIANVRTGTSYSINGVSLTGTFSGGGNSTPALQRRSLLARP